MFIIQVTINPADQNSSVLVAHPPGNGHVVDATHHGMADEVVAAIVEAETFHTGNVSGFAEYSFKSFGRIICGW